MDFISASGTRYKAKGRIKRGGQAQVRSARLVQRGGQTAPGLTPRQRVAIKHAHDPEVSVTVKDVVLPESVLALEGLGDTPVELIAPETSILTRPALQLIRGFVPGAPAKLWLAGEEWKIQVGAGLCDTVVEGGRWQVGGATLRAVSIPLGAVAVKSTVRRGQLHPPMKLTVYMDKTQVEIPGRPPVTLKGRGARVIAELVCFDEPTPWSLVAEEIWKRKPADRALARELWQRKLRENLDAAIKQLRNQLRRHNLRADLVRRDGTGVLELYLFPGDEVINKC